jgi:catechol 2,3-dioxygenase-like lactoylglutathione lyase family enzyme
MTTITQVATVFVPVADQDAALDFYTGVLGFEKRGDFPYGGGLRWVEVAPPGSTFALALVPRGEGVPSGEAVHCALVSSDIETEFASLRGKGVTTSDVIAREGTSRAGLVTADVSVPDPVPAQFVFSDPDGNRFLVIDGN